MLRTAHPFPVRSGALTARWLLGSLLAASLVPACFAADAIEGEPVATGSASTEPPLLATPTTRDHVGRVVVPVTINGRGPFRFVVDTGANRSTISPALAKTLGLEPIETTPVVLNGITGSARVNLVTVDRLQTGDLTLEGESLPVVSAAVMAGADGILGAAGLKSQSLLVDFQHNRVAIARSLTPALRAQSAKMHALRLTYGLITVEARVGGVRVQAVIDTGSERTLGNMALRNALYPKARLGTVVQLTTVYGATEETESGEIRPAPAIVLQSLRMNDVKVVYGSFHIFDVWKMTEKPAMIIGMDVLGTVPVLGVDFERQDVYMAGISGLTQPFVPSAGELGTSMQKR